MKIIVTEIKQCFECPHCNVLHEYCDLSDSKEIPNIEKIPSFCKLENLRK